MIPTGAVTLTPEQLARLDKAVIARPSRKYEDPYGNLRVTTTVIDDFVSDLCRYHKRNGYLTAKQFARIAKIVGD